MAGIVFSLFLRCCDSFVFTVGASSWGESLVRSPLSLGWSTMDGLLTVHATSQVMCLPPHSLQKASAPRVPFRNFLEWICLKLQKVEMGEPLGKYECSFSNARTRVSK